MSYYLQAVWELKTTNKNNNFTDWWCSRAFNVFDIDRDIATSMIAVKENTDIAFEIWQ